MLTTKYNKFLALLILSHLTAFNLFSKRFIFSNLILIHIQWIVLGSHTQFDYDWLTGNQAVGDISEAIQRKSYFSRHKCRLRLKLITSSNWLPHLFVQIRPAILDIFNSFFLLFNSPQHASIKLNALKNIKNINDISCIRTVIKLCFDMLQNQLICSNKSINLIPFSKCAYDHCEYKNLPYLLKN